MGGERKVKTYSRHHGSRIVAVDKGLWDSSEEQQKHLFSLSSESSINSSDSHDFRKTRSTRKKSENKENRKQVARKTNIKKKYGSDMESSGSTGNDSLFSSYPRRRALRDRSNTVPSKQNGKRKRQPASPVVVKPTQKKSENSYNFSEFDDYSLCISGSPPKDANNDKSASVVLTKNVSQKPNVIETSTPLAKRTRSYVSFSKDDTGQCADISLIDSGPNSPSVASEADLGLSTMSSIVESPMVIQSGKNCNSEKLRKNGNLNLDNSEIQLQKLRNSLLMMHISGRRDKKISISSHFDQSASLFSNVSESRVDADEATDESDDEAEEESTEEQSDEEEECSDVNSSLSDIDEDEEAEPEEDNRESDSESSVKSSSQNSTRYMLNEDNSEYDTAESSTTDKSYHTAEERSRYLMDVNSPCVFSPRVTRGRLKSPLPTPNLENRSVGNLKSLNSSLIVMLTPVKKKDADSKKTEMSPKSKIFQICQQEDPITFQSCIPPSMMKICTKVGEGVYGEVFRTLNNGQSVAIKVIPIEGDFDVNDEPQKTFEGMLPEIVISKELSLLRTNKTAKTENFCEVNSVCCVKGKYPRELLKQWDKFHEEKESQNDRPDVFTEDQLFIVFEFADGGKDLESAKFHNIYEAKSVLVQVAFSLAVAEEVLQFEHRDLHWGNVLVQKTKNPYLKYQLMGQKFKVESHNVHVSIIDFTLSRLHTDGVTTYSDLSTDETLFQGTGDYQFDIYRKMKEENGNDWKKFTPKSNVWWLHYLTEKLLRNKRYTRNTKDDQATFREMRLFMKEIPNFSSACELVTCSNFFSCL